MVATLNVTASRTAVQRPSDIAESLAYARNPFEFIVTLTGADTFADLLSARLVLREFPHPIGELPLAEVIWSSPTGTTHTFSFTDAQFNQLAADEGTTYWAILSVIDPTDGTIVLWRGKLTLIPSFATEDTAPAPATTTKLTLAEANELFATLAALDAHTSNTSNPHAVTKSQVGLGNADNTADADKPVSTAQAAADTAVANAVANAAATALGNHTSSTSNPHSVTKSQVGLGNADNTADADKPVSTAQRAAINLKTSYPEVYAARYASLR